MVMFGSVALIITIFGSGFGYVHNITILLSLITTFHCFNLKMNKSRKVTSLQQKGVQFHIWNWAKYWAKLGQIWSSLPFKSSHHQLIKHLYATGTWIDEGYHIQLWTSVQCTTPWAVSLRLGDDKLFIGLRHNIYTLFMILFCLFDLILLFVWQICHVNCQKENWK